jgi:hypothetical protein
VHRPFDLPLAFLCQLHKVTHIRVVFSV